MPRVIIVADDLTGALDSAVAFAGRGFSTLAACSPERLAAALDAGPDVVAVSTSTREADESAAVDVLEAVGDRLAGHGAILFKKVDSRLKGHVAAETRVLARSRAAVPLVCPAIPRLGRLVVNGMVVGAGVEAPIPVAGALGGLAAEIVDSRSDGDLDAALRGPLDERLLVGAAGLAEALARLLRPHDADGAQPRLRSPALFAIGTRDPVTLAQVEALIAARPEVEVVSAPNGLAPAAAGSDAALRLLRMVPGEVPVPQDEAAARFAEAAVSMLGFAPAATLVASGGECADAILRRLGIGLLAVEGEILPGIPVSAAFDGGPALRIVTKSGGFGGRETLVALARLLS